MCLLAKDCVVRHVCSVVEQELLHLFNKYEHVDETGDEPSSLDSDLSPERKKRRLALYQEFSPANDLAEEFMWAACTEKTPFAMYQANTLQHLPSRLFSDLCHTLSSMWCVVL